MGQGQTLYPGADGNSQAQSINNSYIEDDKSTLVSRNITVMGRRTSVRLEPEMWNALREIARREKCKIHDICSLIHARKNPHTSLTAAIRVFLMLYYRAAATDEGHKKAGHDDFGNMMQRARVTWEMIHPGSQKNAKSESLFNRLNHTDHDPEAGLRQSMVSANLIR